MNFSGVVSSGRSGSNFLGKNYGSINSLTDIALYGTSYSEDNYVKSKVSDYLYTITECGVIKSPKPQLNQTDSILYFPVFGSYNDNKQPLISPSKLWDSDTSRPSNTRGGSYDELTLLSDTNVTHSQNGVNVNISLPNNYSPLSLNTNNSTVDAVLDYSGYFVSFWTTQNVNNTHISIKKGGKTMCEISPSNSSTRSYFNSSPVKFTSDIFPNSLNTTVTPSGPGLYFANIRKIEGVVNKGSEFTSISTNATKVPGYSLEINGYYLAAESSTPVVLFSHKLSADTSHGFEDQFLYKNITGLEDALYSLSGISGKPSKTDLLASFTTKFGSVSPLTVYKSYVGKNSGKGNKINEEDIENFYAGKSRISINKQVHTKLKALYNSTPFVLNKKSSGLSEESADKLLRSFRITEDFLEPKVIDTYNIVYGVNYGRLDDQIKKTGTFIYPGNGIDNSYRFEPFIKNRFNTNNSYKFFGAGTGINSEEDALKFMVATKDFILSLPTM